MAGPTHDTLDLPTFEDAPKVLIVCAPYYRAVADDLIAGATTVLEAAGATHETIEVPGALEVPPAIGIAGRMSNYDGFVALGCVIRGETSHYETVCNDSLAG
jgi:Riboflavin synthase beta-chain